MEGTPDRLAWRVHHQLPTRTRFLAHGRGVSLVAPESLERAVVEIPGVSAVRFDATTGSLLVVHDRDPHTHERLRQALENLQLAAVDRGSSKPRGAGREVEAAPLREALLSFLGAVLPPIPRAALTLARSLAPARPMTRPLPDGASPEDGGAVAARKLSVAAAR